MCFYKIAYTFSHPESGLFTTPKVKIPRFGMTFYFDNMLNIVYK